MSRITEILAKLNDGASTIVDIPSASGETRRFNSVLKKQAAPNFELLFPPDSWQTGEFAPGTKCRMAVNHEGRSLNLTARIEAYSGERRITFTAEEAIRPEELREYFRVSMNITAKVGYRPGPKEKNPLPWSLTGTTVDLSGSGVLIVLPKKPDNFNRLGITLFLPEHAEPVSCIGHIVQTYRMRKGRCQAAFHFDDIDGKTRDLIIAACLQEQRRQLRENVQVD